jgi:23S rRNA A2030 N6-methylase RlmJ
LATVVPPAAVVVGEGFHVLASWQPTGVPLLLVDPAFVRREEWDEVPAAVSAAVARVPGLTGLLWYPIKAFTRPHQLQHALRRAGTSATAIDLVSTSVALRRPALAGSGVVVFGAPPGFVARLIALAGALGPALATRPPEWELRVTAW